jgi:hypothetical protein
MANHVPALEPSLLCRHSPAAELPFATTAELEPLSEPLGQERALEALRFGVTRRFDRDTT